MTRILILTPHFPYPPHQGGAMRAFGMIRGLAGRGYKISLLAFVTPDQPDPQTTPLAGLCEQIVTIPAPTRSPRDRMADLLAGKADMARRFWSDDFAAALRDLLAARSFDVIQMAFEMVDYLPILKQSGGGAMLIYDSLNAEYDLQRRIAASDLLLPRRWPLAGYSVIQATRLSEVETDLCRAVDHVFACSGADARLLARLDHRTPITVIPNAITAADYAYTGPPADLPHPLLVITGKMDFRPNVDAVLWLAGDILPRIRREVPAAHLAVVGQKPTPHIAALAARPGVAVTGGVPDIQPYLAAADVYVAPLRMGSGTRFKLLEALAMGCPVVSTRLGAEGLDVQDGEHLLLADTAADFARAVVDLLGDDPRRQRLGEAGQRLVREHYDWSAIIPRIEAVYASAPTSGA